jgi:hypothetical protein
MGKHLRPTDVSKKWEVRVRAGTTWRFASIFTLSAAAALAQTPSVQDLQKKLLEFEESTQKTIQDLKAQIAALQETGKPAGVAPHPTVTPQVSEVPVVHTPVEYYGTETRTRRTAGENEAGAPRIDNEPLDPELLGFFHLPGTSTYVKFGGFVKTDLFYDLNFAGTYYGAYVPSSFPASPTPHSGNSTVSMRPTRFSWETRVRRQNFKRVGSMTWRSIVASLQVALGPNLCPLVTSRTVANGIPRKL